MTLRICIPFLLTSTVFALQLTPSDRTAADMARKQIRADHPRPHAFLSDRMLQGRAPDTPGYDIAARYVASELESMGLHPAGDRGTWYQEVPLRSPK